MCSLAISSMFPVKSESISCSVMSDSGILQARILEWAQFSSVQSLSHVQLFATPWTAAHQVSLFSTTPDVCSNSCPLSQWCDPIISSSVIPTGVGSSSLLQGIVPTQGSNSGLLPFRRILYQLTYQGSSVLYYL